MKVCKSDITKRATNRIGIKLSTDTTFAINNFSHLHADTAITDTMLWTEISAVIVADSAYQYLAIGNFFTDDSTTVIEMCPACPQVPTEYMIDDICIHKGEQGNCEYTVSTKPFSILADASLLIYQTTDRLNIVAELPKSDTYKICVYNALGQRILQTFQTLHAGKTTLSIPFESSAADVLFVQLSNGEQSITKPFVATRFPND
jgi:hypothetical protein